MSKIISLFNGDADIQYSFVVGLNVGLLILRATDFDSPSESIQVKDEPGFALLNIFSQESLLIKSEIDKALVFRELFSVLILLETLELVLGMTSLIVFLPTISGAKLSVRSGMLALKKEYSGGVLISPNWVSTSGDCLVSGAKANTA